MAATIYIILIFLLIIGVGIFIGKRIKKLREEEDRDPKYKAWRDNRKNK